MSQDSMDIAMEDDISDEMLIALDEPAVEIKPVVKTEPKVSYKHILSQLNLPIPPLLGYTCDMSLPLIFLIFWFFDFLVA